LRLFTLARRLLPLEAAADIFDFRLSSLAIADFAFRLIISMMVSLIVAFRRWLPAMMFASAPAVCDFLARRAC